MSVLCIEPGSRLFRVKDTKGRLHALSSYLVREAETGDGVCFPEEYQAMESPPEVVELWPWDTAGGVREFASAQDYLSLLKKRFGPLFGRCEWKLVLSPHVLASQRQVWNALLRDCSVRHFQLISNLECLSWKKADDSLGLFLHWGAGGADLGACLQGETYRYQRLPVGEDQLVKQLRDWLTAKSGQPLPRDEAYRLLRLVASVGLTFPGGRLVEIDWGEQASPWRASLEQEVLLQVVLKLIQPQLEAVEEFVRSLSAADHSDLFRHGLRLSGGGIALTLLHDCLKESFEFPVHLEETPDTSILLSPRLALHQA